jgi:hypothetical protein
MVAASRPAVSAAAARLAKEGQLERDGDLWLLRGRPPPELERTGVGLLLPIWQSGQVALMDAFALLPL